MSKPMPPCKIEFGANSDGVLQTTYTFEGYEPSVAIIAGGPLLPTSDEVKEIWRLATDPKEREPLRLVKDDDGN